MSHLEPAVGFAPASISSSVNAAVLALHAEDAPFLWRLRTQAAGAPHHGLDSLRRLDDRLAGHLQGLMVQPAAGWQAMLASMNEADGGQLFALACLAFGSGNAPYVSHALQLAAALPEPEAPLLAALAWLPKGTAQPWAQRMAQSSQPVWQRLALAALGVHQCVSAAQLQGALLQGDALTRLLAIRLAGEGGHAELSGPLAEVLAEGLATAADPLERAWAGWSLTLLGHPSGPPALLEHVRVAGPLAWHFTTLAMLANPMAHGREVVRDLLARPGCERLAVHALGALGDPASLPWLLARCEDPALCKLAGESCSRITGVHLEDEGLTLPPEDAPDDDAAPPADTPALVAGEPAGHDADLPQPDPARLHAHLSAHSQDWVAGQRHLCGQVLTRAASLSTLRRGRQRERQAAALFLKLQQPAEALFDVQAPGRRQRQRMAAWSS